MHAEQCPVCKGKGHDNKICVLDGFYTACYGCEGKGWVEVRSTEELNEAMDQAVKDAIVKK